MTQLEETAFLAKISELTDYIATNQKVSEVFYKAIEVIVACLPSQNVLIAELKLEGEKILYRANQNPDKCRIEENFKLPTSIFNILLDDFTNIDFANHDHCKLLETLFGREKIHQGVSVLIPGQQRPIGIILICASKFVEFSATQLAYIKTIACVLGNLLNTHRAFLKTALELRNVEGAKCDLESIIDSLPDIICLIDNNGGIVRTNNVIETWGISRVADVKGKTIHELLHPKCSHSSCEFSVKWKNARLNEDWDNLDWEVNDKILDKKLHISLRKLVVSDEHRRELTAGYVVAIIKDKTHLQLQEKIAPLAPKQVIDLKRKPKLATGAINRLDTREFTSPIGLIRNLDIAEQQSVLLDNNIVGIYIAYEGTIIYCNKQFSNILGFSTADELVFKKLNDLFIATADENGEIKSPNVTIGTDDALQQIFALSANGEKIWLSRREIEIWSEGRLLNLGYVVDITQQKSMSEIILKSQKELHALSRQLLNAQEDERKKLASELHDSIGQHLSAAKMEVEISLKMVAISPQEETAQRLKMAISRIKDTIEEVRNLSMDLRPSTLDDLGLLITLAWFCRQYHSAYPNLTVELEKTHVEEKDIPENLKVVIYRIIQEALNNIAKHAQASSIVVQVEKIDENQLKLYIKDNGIGFDIDTVSTVEGDRVKFGLKSMRERVESTGGSFKLESNKKEGTVIEALWRIT